jgi:hypothetical protein
MTGIRLLDSIDAKRPDSVNREGFNVRHTPNKGTNRGRPNEIRVTKPVSRFTRL